MLIISIEMILTIVKVHDIHFKEEPLPGSRMGTIAISIGISGILLLAKGMPLTALPDDWSWSELSNIKNDKL